SDDDFTPPPRDPLHSNPQLCRDLLSTIKSAVPLAIRSSKISPGSGLFVEKEIEASREIYRSFPLMACVDTAVNNNHTVCHYCLRDTKEPLSGGDKVDGVYEEAKACSACKVARFCSKGAQLRMRSLRKIEAGEELTICYVDPTIDVVARQQLLKKEHFFDCYCPRCKSETHEQALLTTIKSKSKSSTFLPTLHTAQSQILSLLSSAVLAAKYPNMYPQFTDLNSVETQLRAITSTAFSHAQPPQPQHWPDHLEPLPAARLSLATLYLNQDKPLPALRNALRGKLMSRRRQGPEWANEMLEVISILLLVGSTLPSDGGSGGGGGGGPDVQDIRAVAYGYLYEVARQVGSVFGSDCAYAAKCKDVFTTMAARKAEPRVGTKDFADEFDKAQEGLMRWAGV
ncbi:hypothetical protein B0T17DRAFT_462455, partial [Bombardia bombarda]